MAYNYQEQRANLFTEEGQVLFLKIRDRTKYLLNIAGAARMQEMMSGCSGSSWDMLACADRMIELNELEELTNNNFAGQFRVFIKKYSGD